MRPYSPETNKGRHLAGHDVHHKTADQPKTFANASAKKLKKAARQEGRKIERGEMADELLATVGRAPPESNTYRCQAPQGYIRPQEPDSFDGHDYEGFIGGCQRMGCKAPAAVGR